MQIYLFIRCTILLHSEMENNFTDINSYSIGSTAQLVNCTATNNIIQGQIEAQELTLVRCQIESIQKIVDDGQENVDLELIDGNEHDVQEKSAREHTIHPKGGLHFYSTFLHFIGSVITDYVRRRIFFTWRLFQHLLLINIVVIVAFCLYLTVFT